MTTKRQAALNKAVARFIPQAPFYDAEAIRSRAKAKHLRGTAAVTAAWLAIIAYIRHVYTPYDALRDEGYEKDAARFFVCDAVNDKLQQWRATRFLMTAETTAERPSQAPAARKTR